LNLGLMHQRHPQVRRATNPLAKELGRHHAYDPERRAVDYDRAADRRRIGTEALSPEQVARHRDRDGTRAIVIV
jgi:hypothetical protein